MLTNSLPDFSSYGYEAIALLGQNRHGGRITYLADEIGSDRQVVIKQFEFGQKSLSWSIQEGLEREAEILKQLDHSRIPCYLNFFQTDTSFCLVQEYKNAPSLAKLRSFAPSEIKEIAISILEILIYLQQKIPAIIHRDIKPENILVDDFNNAYLIDFGFSRIGTEEVSGSSVVKGTPGFMPPEQLWGRLTKASDLYSLGMTLICLLAGIKSAEIRNYIDDDYRVSLKTLKLGVNQEFENWLLKLVQPNPSKRYSDANTALEALQIIKIFPSSSRFKPNLFNQKTRQLLICTAFGLVVGISWGITHQAHILGACLGVMLGWGLSMMLAIPRSNQNFLSIPPTRGIIGAILVAIAIGTLINPGVIVSDYQYTSFNSRSIENQKVGEGVGFTLFTDIPNSVVDNRSLKFLTRFRQEVATHLFDPGKTSCAVDIHLLKEDKNYFAIANRFEIKTPYGFFLGSPTGPNAIVVRQNSGLGTLTHQMMYHYLSCSYPEGLPPWASQGVATFVEKFIAFEKSDRLNFSWGYRSNWRDLHVRQLLASSNVNLANLLREGQQQSVFNSFFLYLHHQKQLIPLLNRLHGEHGDGIDRIEQIFNKSIAQVDRDWRKWRDTKALSLPMVESSFVAWEDRVLQVEKELQKHWVWDNTKQMWIVPQKSSWIVIPAMSP
jgi:serine/threonine protein kinase